MYFIKYDFDTWQLLLQSLSRQLIVLLFSIFVMMFLHAAECFWSIIALCCFACYACCFFPIELFDLLLLTFLIFCISYEPHWVKVSNIVNLIMDIFYRAMLWCGWSADKNGTCSVKRAAAAIIIRLLLGITLISCQNWAVRQNQKQQ